jgi:glyoxylase-like metal-dependent hydrolase (beta-lactamase superfamily II)
MAQAVHTLDLNFQNRNDAIAAFLIPYSKGAVLVESGPGSTIEGLKAGLAEHGYKASDVTHVLLSHIHLDHAGAAGWLAQQGAEVYVHPVGAPHMIDPSKLIASATRIYKEDMDRLWGEFLAVPEAQIHIPEDREKIVIGDLEFTVYFTPGHASHHIAYGFGELVFAGDVGGVRMPGCDYVRLPLVPPELHLGQWKSSLELLLEQNFKRIAPTHFGIFDDAEEHILNGLKVVEATDKWVEGIMPTNPEMDTLGTKFEAWMYEEAKAASVSDGDLETYAIANPLHMSATGISRYWKKFKQAES